MPQVNMEENGSALSQRSGWEVSLLIPKEGFLPVGAPGAQAGFQSPPRTHSAGSR